MRYKSIVIFVFKLLKFVYSFTAYITTTYSFALEKWLLLLKSSTT